MTNPILPSNDVLETVISNIKPSSTHKKLLDALQSKTILNSIRHAKTYDGLRRESGVYASNHELIHKNAREWIKERLSENANNPYAVWEKYKDLGLLYSTTEGSLEHFIMPIGDKPDDFVQMEIYCWNEKITHSLFNKKPWSDVQDVDDILDSSGTGRGHSLDQPINTGNVYYEFGKIFIASDLIARYNDIRLKQLEKHSNISVSKKNPATGQWEQVSYDEAYPEAKKSLSNPSRLMQDWIESSAGLGNYVFSDHWVLNNTEWQDNTGKENINIVPYWTAKKPINEIKYKKNVTAYQLFDIADKIDKKSGYPFAWYFYMLHGNRVKDWFGVLMLQAAESGLIFMPEHDYRVLKRWNNLKYGF